MSKSRISGLGWLALPLICGALLRLAGVFGQSLWLDEGASLYFSSLSLDELLCSRGFDPTPLAFPLALKAWMLVSLAEPWLRLLPALCGLCLIWLCYLCGRELYRDERAGLLAAWVAALSPLALRYSLELRAYSLWAALCALSLYALLRLVRGGGKFWLGGFALSLGLALHTHYATWLYLPGLYLFGFLLTRREGLKCWPLNLGFALALALFLPSMPYFLANLRLASQGFWVPAPDTDAVLRAAGHIVANFPGFGTLGVAACTLPWLLGLPLAAYFSGTWPGPYLLVALPFALALLSGALYQPILLARLNLAGLSGLAVLCGGLWAAPGPNCRGFARTLAGSFLIMLLLGDFIYFSYPEAGHQASEPWPEAAAEFTAWRKPGDLALFAPDAGRLAFAWYYPGRFAAGELAGYPENFAPCAWPLYRPAADTPERAQSFLAALPSQVKRIWLYQLTTQADSPHLRQALAERGRLSSSRDIGLIKLSLYELK